MVTNVGAKQLDFGAPAFNDVVATASASVASVSIDKMFGSDINGEAIAANTLGSFIGNQLAAQAKQHYADYQAKKAFEAELKISQIPTIHQEIEASERRFIQSIAAHPNDQGSAPSSPQSSQGGNSRVASAKSTPPHKPHGNAGNSGGSDTVSFEASRSHVEVASAQREKQMSRAQRWNEESHRAKTQPPRSSQASKNGFWSVLEEMGDSRFIAMVNEVGNSLNPFITIPRDVGEAVHAFQSGQTADGFKAVGSAVLDVASVVPIDGVVINGIGHGIVALGSKMHWFKNAATIEKVTSSVASDRLQLEKLRTQYRQAASWVNPSEIKNQKLYRIVEGLYREKATIGSGSTADALRVERAMPGMKIGEKMHSIKANDSVKALNELLRNGSLSSHEYMIAENIKLDLLDSMGKKLWYSQTNIPKF